jgi:nucleolar protein 15
MDRSFGLQPPGTNPHIYHHKVVPNRSKQWLRKSRRRSASRVDFTLSAIQLSPDKDLTAPAVAPTSEAPQKRLKKQKVTKDESPLASNLSKTKTPSSAISDTIPPPVAEINFAAVKSKKNRKRAVDFLSDNGENAESREERKETATNPKKKAKKVKSEQSENIKASTEEAFAQQLTTKVKSQKKAKVLKEAGSDATAKGAKKAKMTEWPTNEMTQVVNKVLSNGDSLTADGVNGILEHSSEEDVDIFTANEDPSSSMQAEAQRTVDKEMADEIAIEDESDDQGAALLAGFDSDGDDSGEDEGLDPANMTDLNLNKQQRKKLRQATRKESKEGTGAVYVGRIPRGFYEAQMRQYFSQFGTITNLRLSRNKTTGASKHFAFIEFESNEVAKIVAQTMDNYLMFGHILKCKYAPSESLHPDTWKGANKRFKIVPYNKIEKRMLEEPKTKDQWEGKIAREQDKREKRLSKAQSMGYNYELPEIQGVDAALERHMLGQQVDSKPIEPAAEVEKPTGAMEPPNGVPKDVVALKGRQRKRSKGKSAPATENTDAEAPVNSLSAEVIPLQKASKVKKDEADSDGIPPTTLTEAPVDTAPKVDKPTGKKAKKTKRTAATSEVTLPTTSIEAETVAPVSATEATKSAPVKTKKPKKQANVAVVKFTKSTPDPPGGTVDAAALVHHKSFERDAPPAKFAFHPDEIAELTKPTEAENEATQPKTKTKKQKKSKATATDAAAAQMQLNAELNDTVSPLKSKGKGKEQAFESDIEIAATATAVLPTPGGGEKKAQAGKKAKQEEHKAEVEAHEPKKTKKAKKAKVEA